MLSIAAGARAQAHVDDVVGAADPSRTQAARNASDVLPEGVTPELKLPAPNACMSPYDAFYEAEPGVYAFWALCETSSDSIGYDYAGEWPLVHGFATGASIVGGVRGPVPDGEGAARAMDATARLEQQGIFLNRHAGTLAAWINANATSYAVPAASFRAITGRSGVALAVSRRGSECFAGELSGADGQGARIEVCGYAPDTWHRVVLTWNERRVSLYVDATLRGQADARQPMEASIFYYQLFPGCCKTGKQMTLAKVAVANQAWTEEQIGRDFKPVLPAPPQGGVEVTGDTLGTIHKDVLGYVDNNQDIAEPGRVVALRKGLKAAGVTAVRYSGGGFADAEDWHGGPEGCTALKGQRSQSRNRKSENTLDRYEDRVAKPLGLQMSFVVNYGSNPPMCDAGGDPVVNAADLVRYANGARNDAIRFWEIGNEQYAYGGGPLIDDHPNPYIERAGAARSTYPVYEPAFYDAMKAVDPAIEIGVPSVGRTGSYNAVMNYQIPLLRKAKFDALVLHDYPIDDPITDGATLYPERVASGTQVRGTLLSLQTELLSAGKPKDAIWVTEWNAEKAGNRWSRQTMGAVMPLFAAMELAEFMRAGVQFASWQAQGETDVCSSYNYDPAAAGAYSWWDGCGDTSLVYTGAMHGAGETPIGLKPGDLTPAARAFQVLSESGFVTEGEHMLRCELDAAHAPWLMAYAATHGQTFAVLLINRDRDNAQHVPVRIVGKTKGGAVTQWTYGRAQYDASRGGDWSAGPVVQRSGPWSGSFDAEVPAWSISVLVFSP